MKRKEFLKKLSISSLSLMGAPLLLKGEETRMEKDKSNLNIVGFNHLPNKEIKTIVPVVSSTLKAINESIYS